MNYVIGMSQMRHSLGTWEVPHSHRAQNRFELSLAQEIVFEKTSLRTPVNTSGVWAPFRYLQSKQESVSIYTAALLQVSCKIGKCKVDSITMETKVISIHCSGKQEQRWYNSYDYLEGPDTKPIVESPESCMEG